MCITMPQVCGSFRRLRGYSLEIDGENIPLCGDTDLNYCDVEKSGWGLMVVLVEGSRAAVASPRVRRIEFVAGSGRRNWACQGRIVKTQPVGRAVRLEIDIFGIQK